MVEGSHIPGSVWPAVAVVCEGRMVGMLTRVWTGPCCMAASDAVVRAGGRGAGDAVGLGSLCWGLFWCCCCRSFCDC